MLLLTDGRVLVHEEPNCSGTGCVGTSYTAWYTLTPDITGSYVNGTWTKVASLPSGYAPLFFGSAVLPDGSVVVQGGEYNCPGGSCSPEWQAAGAWYNPATNKWTATTAPFASGVESIGDAESVVLPNGTWMLAACCAFLSGASPEPDYFYFNESTLTFTSEANSTDGKADEFDEEGWTLLPNGNVLTVDAYVGSFTSSSCANGGCNSETYNPSTNKWTTAGSTKVQLWDSNCSGSSSSASYELGPAILMPNGTVFYTGASDCRAGNIATYNWSTGAWTAQSAFPNSDAANDAPASIEINGNAIVMASPFSGTFSSPSNFYEWNGTALSSFPNPANAANDASYVGHLLVLPTGQIMFTDFTTGVEVATSAGTYEAAWQPTISSVPSALTPGTTYTVSGTQLNGVSDGAAYGDDFQDFTNYPLVRIVNTATGNVYYAKTHGFSTMGVGTGSTVVSAMFDVPATMPTGACELYVVTNGIPSAASACTVGSGGGKTVTATALSSSVNPSNIGQAVTFTATVTPVNSPAPTGTVAFTSNGTAITGCTAVTLPASGKATCATTFNTAGTYSIVATYSGDSNYDGSTSPTLSQVVNQNTSTTSLASSLNPSNTGQAVTFTATITPATATGTVGFTSNGTTLTGCGTVTVAAGSAACNATFNTAGTYSIVATYSGDTNDTGSTSATLSQVVNTVTITTTTTLTTAPNPSNANSKVTMTATVTASNSTTPTGAVAFYSNGTVIGASNLVSGVAVLYDSGLPVGTFNIVAVYAGSGGYTTSTSNTVAQVVNGDATTTALTSSTGGSSVPYGTSITFTATVTATTGTPSGGTVRFFNGTSLLGSGTVNASGVASFTTSKLPVGTNSITANYLGFGNFGVSTSPAFTQVVTSSSVKSPVKF
jgi:hypothetical protein